jgi:two-component system, chemotaxis family, protein-glutamate methylesterase/glutaminase
MESCPTPIVVVSSNVESADLLIAFNAIQAGALDVVEKPAGLSHADFATIRERLLTTIKLMAEVKVVRRHRPRNRPAGAKPALAAVRGGKPPAILAIGASTGGPIALNTLLKALPSDFPLPIVVVQHMAAGFTHGLVEWLQLESRLPLKIAQHEQRIVQGEVYFAPDGCHLELCSRTTFGLSQAPPVSFVRPSVTVLFESVARTYGAEAIGVLLTGMGEDGATGLKVIHDHGGVTLAQDEASCVVYGMPAVAVRLGAAGAVLPLDRIAPTLRDLVQMR